MKISSARLLSALIIGAVYGCAAERAQEGRSDSPGAAEWSKTLEVVGRRLPEVRLRNLTDFSELHLSFPAPGPLGLLVFHAEDCFSCSRLPAEAWDLSRWMQKRGGRVLVVVVAASAAGIGDYATRYRMPGGIYLDSTGWASGHFGSAVHPLVALISPTGAVASVMSRTPASADRYPLSQVLDELERIAVGKIQ